MSEEGSLEPVEAGQQGHGEARRRKRSALSPEALARAEQQRQAFAMRRDGASVEDIAADLGASRATVYRWLQTALRQLRKAGLEDVAAWADLENERIDRWQSRLEKRLANDKAPLTVEQEVKVVSALRQLSERRGRLQALEAGPCSLPAGGEVDAVALLKRSMAWIEFATLPEKLAVATIMEAAMARRDGTDAPAPDLPARQAVQLAMGAAQKQLQQLLSSGQDQGALQLAGQGDVRVLPELAAK